MAIYRKASVLQFRIEHKVFYINNRHTAILKRVFTILVPDNLLYIICAPLITNTIHYFRFVSLQKYEEKKHLPPKKTVILSLINKKIIGFIMEKLNLNISISGDSHWNIKADADENRLSMVMDIIKLIMGNCQIEDATKRKETLEKYDIVAERRELERVLHRNLE